MEQDVFVQRFEQQLAFVREVDKMKSIYRQTCVVEEDKRENDAEHSWHLAVLLLLFQEYAPWKVDISRAVKMVLFHDVVEIDAGDTYAYDHAALASKEERELLAADRIFAILPADQAVEFRALWDEFEEQETPESIFANVVDRIQPFFLNHWNGWEERGLSRSDIYKRNALVREYFPRIWEYMELIIAVEVERGNLLNS